MNVAIFSDNFFPELSGITDSIVSLGRQLAARGHQVRFYAPRASAKNFKTASLPVKELDLGKNVSVYRFASFPYPSPTQQSRLVIPTGLRWLAVKKFRPDIVHSQSFFGVGLEALITAKILDIPFVGTNHTAITEFTRYSPFRPDLFNKYSLKAVSWYYNRCDFVTAPSQSVFNEMLKNGFDRPHQVMSNPIENEIFKPLENKTELKKMFGLSNNTIVFASRLAVEKKFDVLIKAVSLVKKQVPDINFAIAGHGEGEAELKQLAKDSAVENEVKFLGTLSKPDLAKLYNASEIFVIASTSETQSMTLMQAMACSLPAIGVRARALPEYIKESAGIIVEPDKPEAMAEKIIYLLKNPEARQNLGAGAYAFLQDFSAPAIGEQWEKLYAKIITLHNQR